MNKIEGIITALKEWRERVDTAIRLLEKIGDDSSFSRNTKRRRHMSAAARKRIAANMKARWAQAKKAGRNSL